MDVPLDDAAWDWDGARVERLLHRGRDCVRLGSEVQALPLARGVELLDGAVEAELAVEPGRSFHGLVWRVADRGGYESFFIRPHQRGNDDSVQYTPVFNGQPAWQLHHGPGYWAPVAFPLGGWFTLRVVCGGRDLEVLVDDEPVLGSCLLRPAAPGGVGLMVAGEGLHVARLAVDREARPSRAAEPPPAVEGAILAWEVSEPFAEGEWPDTASLAWTPLEAEPCGRLNLSRAHPLAAGRNTVFARTTIRSGRAETRELAFGFSDRAVVALNGRRLFRGDDGYRTRDYRFLGSMGWWDRLYLPLDAGDNELLLAVSEDFGGWGVQARLVG